MKDQHNRICKENKNSALSLLTMAEEPSTPCSRYIDVGIITPTRGVCNAATLWEYNNYRISACQEVCQTLMEAYPITLSPELI